MCHVLIIEDEWLIGEHIEAIARNAGATSVDRAETETNAVTTARAHPPAAILSDVKLAEGTGPRAVSTILAELGACPVIFITGTPEECNHASTPTPSSPSPYDPPRSLKHSEPSLQHDPEEDVHGNLAQRQVRSFIHRCEVLHLVPASVSVRGSLLADVSH